MPTNFIAASISWNSKKWKDLPTQEDINKSNFGHVKKHGEMFESHNFYMTDNEDGYIYGYIPANPKIKKIKICVFTSLHHKEKRHIVGFYFDTEFGNFQRNHSTNIYHANLKVKKENVILLDNYIEINNVISSENSILKQVRPLKYLLFNDICEILLKAQKINSHNKSLATLYHQYIFYNNESNLEKVNIDSKNLLLLDEMLSTIEPTEKEHISHIIERSCIAKKIKKINNYRCQVCEAIGLPSQSFLKKNGTHYIEAHHVIPIYTKEKGVLSVKNIITLCANHHRQMHHGNVELIESDDSAFSFRIDNDVVKINKTKISEES